MLIGTVGSHLVSALSRSLVNVATFGIKQGVTQLGRKAALAPAVAAGSSASGVVVPLVVVGAVGSLLFVPRVRNAVLDFNDGALRKAWGRIKGTAASAVESKAEDAPSAEVGAAGTTVA